MKSSDYLIDIGWGAGEQGGNIVAEGTWKQVSSNMKSITGQFLSGKQSINVPKIEEKVMDPKLQLGVLLRII